MTHAIPVLPFTHLNLPHYFSNLPGSSVPLSFCLSVTTAYSQLLKFIQTHPLSV